MRLNLLKVDPRSKMDWSLVPVAVFLSLLCGWATKQFIIPLACLGLPGGLAMYVVWGGPHGPHGPAQEVIGKIVYVIADAIFYFYGFQFLILRWLSKREK